MVGISNLNLIFLSRRGMAAAWPRVRKALISRPRDCSDINGFMCVHEMKCAPRKAPANTSQFFDRLSTFPNDQIIISTLEIYVPTNSFDIS